jgi:hypothetical protein
MRMNIQPAAEVCLMRSCIVQAAVKSGTSQVLGHGYRPISHYGGNGLVSSMHAVEATFPNTLVSYLKAWSPLKELHDLVRLICTCSVGMWCVNMRVV